MTDVQQRLREALALLRAGRFEEAEAAYRQVVSLQPDGPHGRLGLGQALLGAGRWLEGWPLLEARMQTRPDNASAFPVSYPEWTGQDLRGKRLVVWVEQGFGDQVMLSRFFPVLRELGATVTAVCWEPVAPLLAQLADQVVATRPATPTSLARHDLWTRYFSIPRHLRVTPATLPNAPYLVCPAEKADFGRGYEGRIGLLWRTASQAANARERSIPEPIARRLLDAGLVDLDPEVTGARDFGDTAAILARLKMVVTIDTSVAHVAGAMGVPTLIVLSAEHVDWRWGVHPEKTVWYPSATLIRQSRTGDWDSVESDLLARCLGS